MTNILDLEERAEKLVIDNKAKNIKEAMDKLLEIEERRGKSDLAIFYKDFKKIKDIFPELFDEEIYNYSTIRHGIMPAGCLGRVKKNGDQGIIKGRLIEFVPKEKRKKIRIAAMIRNFPYEGKDGIYLAPYSITELNRKGVAHKFDDLYRIELGREMRKTGDCILSMFNVWEEKGPKDYSLVLYIPKSGVVPCIF